jgi:hypothetical protein
MISRFLCLMPALALAISCAGTQNSRMGTLALNLQCDPVFASSRAIANGGAKPASIGPSEDWSPSRFMISGTGPGSAELSLESSDTAVERKLVPGEWTIVIKAFSAAGKEVASGLSICLLQPGRTTSAKIVLFPVEGSGDLSLAIDKNLEVPAGGRITGSLSFKGLPGKPAPQASMVLPFDIPAEQATLAFEGLAAGHYGINLKLADSDGIISGGCVETILVMAGFLTSGSCAITMGMPVVDLSAVLFPASSLPAPLASVEHSYSGSVQPLPLAISRYAPEGEETMLRRWYGNGEEAGPAVELIGNRGVLPAGTFAYPRAIGSSSISVLRADFVEESQQSFRAGSASVTLDAGDSCENSGIRWRASYNYASALGPSLGETTGVMTNGTGRASPIKAVAGSPSGLIAVLGLDDPSALHVFAAGYGAELDPATSPDAAHLSIDASWIRLWRNKTKVGSTFRNPDRLAVSNDGRFIATALEGSNWIWLGLLDEKGLFVNALTVMSTDDADLANMSSIRGLCFSADSRKLYVAARAKGTIYAFSVGETGISLASSCELDTQNDTLPLKDIEVTRSGNLVVSAEDSSTIYLLADGTGLGSLTAIQGNSESDPYHPTAITISEEDDAFYVLCDEDEVVCFSRTDPLSPYSQASSFSLPYEAEGANCLAVGKSPTGGGEILAAAGGDSLIFFEMAADRTPDTTAIFPASSCGQADIADANALSYINGAFVLSGGASGIVSVFGRD